MSTTAEQEAWRKLCDVLKEEGVDVEVVETVEELDELMDEVWPTHDDENNKKALARQHFINSRHETTVDAPTTTIIPGTATSESTASDEQQQQTTTDDETNEDKTWARLTERMKQEGIDVAAITTAEELGEILTEICSTQQDKSIAIAHFTKTHKQHQQPTSLDTTQPPQPPLEINQPVACAAAAPLVLANPLTRSRASSLKSDDEEETQPQQPLTTTMTETTDDEQEEEDSCTSITTALTTETPTMTVSKRVVMDFDVKDKVNRLGDIQRIFPSAGSFTCPSLLDSLKTANIPNAESLVSQYTDQATKLTQPSQQQQLTAEEIAVILMFHCEDTVAMKVNNTLCTRIIADLKSLRPLLWRLLQSLRHLPLTSPSVDLFCGSLANIMTNSSKGSCNYEVGKTVTWHRIVTTTTELRSVTSQSAKTVFVLRNCSGYDMSSLLLSGRNEVLIEPETNFRIINKETDKESATTTTTTITMERIESPMILQMMKRTLSTSSSSFDTITPSSSPPPPSLPPRRPSISTPTTETTKTTETAEEIFKRGVEHKNGSEEVGDPNPAEAVKLITKAAQLGHLKAMFTLAQLYDNGNCVEKDRATAFKWYLQAAQLNHPDAQFIVGWRLEHGESVECNEREAVKWYQLAAEKDVVEAIEQLAQCFACGKGVDHVDTTEAVRLWRVAVEQHEEYEQAYNIGKHTPKEEEAMKWFLLSAEKAQHAASQFEVAMILLKSHEQEQAVEWLCKAAELGHKEAIEALPDAQFRVGKKLWEMNKRDEAVKRLKVAAEGGVAEAQCMLGRALKNGQGVPHKSASEGAKWLRKAADQGNHAQAQFLLGGLLFTGDEGVSVDKAEAAKWFQRAAEQGHVDACYNLGFCFAEGHGVQQKDKREALKWFTKAAEKGNAQACFEIGCMHGNGVMANNNNRGNSGEAHKWFLKAVELGNPAAPKAQHQAALARSEYEMGLEQWRAGNMAETVKWLRAAATRGHGNAQLHLGNLTVSGVPGGVLAQSFTDGVGWLKQASQQGVAAAHFALARCVFYGQGGEQNKEEAARLYKLAAEAGDAKAQAAIGFMMIEGDVLPKDLAAAKHWLVLAASQGNSDAAQYLSKLP